MAIGLPFGPPVSSQVQFELRWVPTVCALHWLATAVGPHVENPHAHA